MNLQDIRDNITSQEDDALVEMIMNRSNYRSEAMAIAEEEFKKRNFKAAHLKIIKERIDLKNNKEEDLSVKEKRTLIFSIFYIAIKMVGLESFFPKLPSGYEFHHLGKTRKSQKTYIYKIFSSFLWLVFFLISWLIYDSYSATQRYEKYIKNQSANHQLHRETRTTRLG